MNKFKQIVLEAMNDRKDLTIEFMIDHGINPSVFTKHIPLFDPKRNGLIVVQGADKESPYFDTDKDNRNKKCFAGDKLLIAPVKEERNHVISESNATLARKIHTECILIGNEDRVAVIYTTRFRLLSDF